MACSQNTWTCCHHNRSNDNPCDLQDVTEGEGGVLRQFCQAISMHDVLYVHFIAQQITATFVIVQICDCSDCLQLNTTVLCTHWY